MNEGTAIKNALMFDPISSAMRNDLFVLNFRPRWNFSVFSPGTPHSSTDKRPSEVAKEFREQPARRAQSVTW
jgi:hypothetical protein